MGFSKNHAFGLVAACFRSATEIRPKSSEVIPYSCIARRAFIATQEAGVSSP
jgi:hypothetical protein